LQKNQNFVSVSRNGNLTRRRTRGGWIALDLYGSFYYDCRSNRFRARPMPRARAVSDDTVVERAIGVFGQSAANPTGAKA
jgi:hypothetical protein